MLKKTITYTDFNGNSQTEDFYFNLSKPELTALEIGTEGGLDKKLDEITKTKDLAEAMKLFTLLIAKSYGIKSEDGKRFKKSDEISLEFMESAAYEELYTQILADENTAMNFILGILPKDLADQAKTQIAKNNA